MASLKYDDVLFMLDIDVILIIIYICDVLLMIIIDISLYSTPGCFLHVAEDKVVDFLQEDNICYRAMTGKKLLMDRSQFSDEPNAVFDHMVLVELGLNSSTSLTQGD